MTKVFLGVIVVLLSLCGFLYYQNQSLSSLNVAFELRDQEQKAAIESLQDDFKVQTEGLLDVQRKNQQIEQEMNRYLDIFKRHNLSKLAAAKPGLIETRVNNGTKEVFDAIEDASKEVENADAN